MWQLVPLKYRYSSRYHGVVFHNQYLLVTCEVCGRTDRVMASVRSHRLSVKQAAVWSDVTSTPSIIAGSVGGAGRGSRERQRLIEWVTQREGEKKHTHTHTHTYTHNTLHLSTSHKHTHLHVGSLPKVTAIICSKAVRWSEEPVQVFITQVCVCVWGGGSETVFLPLKCPPISQLLLLRRYKPFHTTAAIFD